MRRVIRLLASRGTTSRRSGSLARVWLTATICIQVTALLRRYGCSKRDRARHSMAIETIKRLQIRGSGEFILTPSSIRDIEYIQAQWFLRMRGRSRRSLTVMYRLSTLMSFGCCLSSQSVVVEFLRHSKEWEPECRPASEVSTLQWGRWL